MIDYDGDNRELSYKLFGAFCSGKLKTKELMLNCHWICISENESASFVQDFIDYNMKINKGF